MSKCFLLQYQKNPKSWTELGARYKGDVLTSIVAKHPKDEEGPIGEFFSKKSLTKPKKLKGEPFSLSRYYLLRGNVPSFSA